MAQGNFKKSGGAPKMKGKAGRGNVATKSRRLVNKGKTAVKKGCELMSCCSYMYWFSVVVWTLVC